MKHIIITSALLISFLGCSAKQPHKPQNCDPKPNNVENYEPTWWDKYGDGIIEAVTLEALIDALEP